MVMADGSSLAKRNLPSPLLSGSSNCLLPGVAGIRLTEWVGSSSIRVGELCPALPETCVAFTM